MTNSLEPKTENEIAIRDALYLLLNSSEHALVSSENFLTICRAAPTYALEVIDRHQSYLQYGTASCKEDIAQMARNVEWDLRGPRQFIEFHSPWNPHDSQFIQEKLEKNPNDFSRTDLNLLLSLSTKFTAALSKHIASFAERLATDPPGMSQDIEALKRSIRDYGFNLDLNNILQKIDEELQKTADAFTQAGTMRHIRSFFEKLHESVGKELQRRKPNIGNGTPLGKCGQAIGYLEQKQVLTEKFANLARCLYSILSDDTYGVHALKANRDYTRLCRNMVVEYAVTLFFELERRLAEPGDD